ncbi:MAG: TIGR03619 family F420-dependent LLM class oxidoreductase [Armatimonadetes bacterium]|nr:TIGR03619 family F420-dependent LLM class oxidoreductase [Armatimonadota bacterium]
MEIGVGLPNAGPKATPENLDLVAKWAEEFGYDSIWVTDHVFLPEKVDSWYPYRTHGRWDYPSDTNWLDPLLALGWAAARRKLKVGTSVLVAPIRHPVLLAKQLSTLDYLTDGGVLFGAGAGWMKEESEIMDENFENRGKRLLEMCDLMRLLWSGEIVEFNGQFYKVPPGKMYPPPKRRKIPIVFGGHSDAAIRRVAKNGDGWHPTQIQIPSFREGLAKLRRYCEEYGRNYDDLIIVARAGHEFKVTAEAIQEIRDLGAHHFIADTPIWDAKMDALRAEMERIANVCALKPKV